MDSVRIVEVGGALFALAAEIEKNDMKRNIYLIGSCTLHNIQMALRNAVVNVLGEGGTNDKGEFKKLEEPVLTWWWLVSAYASSFKESKHVWKKICKGIRNSARSNSASMKISSCTLNLIEKPMIMNDLELLVAFHRAFLFPHFKYLQGGDPCTGDTPSFLCRHITIRYFLMVEE